MHAVTNWSRAERLETRAIRRLEAAGQPASPHVSTEWPAVLWPRLTRALKSIGCASTGEATCLLRDAAIGLAECWSECWSHSGLSIRQHIRHAVQADRLRRQHGLPAMRL